MDVGELTTELEERLSSDGSINYITWIESSGIIRRVASIIMGLLCNIILIMVPLIVALEIVYICFPIIREKTDNVLVKIGNINGVSKRLLGVFFRDARHAVESVYSSGNLEAGTSDILWMYARIKIKSIYFIFFLISFILQGSSGVIAWVWNFVGNLVQKVFY